MQYVGMWGGTWGCNAVRGDVGRYVGMWGFRKAASQCFIRSLALSCLLVQWTFLRNIHDGGHVWSRDLKRDWAPC